MTKKGMTVFCLLLGIAWVAVPAWGDGTVYVPLAQNRTTDGNSFVTQVRFHNDSGATRTAQYLFIDASKDGTRINRDTAFTEVEVRPHTTVTLEDAVPRNKRGILEVRLEKEVAVTARLVGETRGGTRFFGVDLPVVTSRNAITPGETAILAGLERQRDEVTSDFYIINLSVENAACAVEVMKRGGTRVTDTVLSIPPLTVFPFFDALGLLGIADTDDASIAVTCDQLAHPYATIHHLDTAQVIYVPPAGDGTSRLNPFPSSDCPANALLSLPGIFHVPTFGKERATYLVDTPNGNFSTLRLTMEFTFGGWDRNSSANHAIFWVNRSQVWRRNVFGYLNAFGPNKNFLKNITNVDLPAGATQSSQEGALLEEGETYTVDYVYSTASRLIEAVVSVKGGQEIARIQDVPTVNRIQSGGEWMVVFGHTRFEHGPEVPTYGWRYANLCLTME